MSTLTRTRPRQGSAASAVGLFVVGLSGMVACQPTPGQGDARAAIPRLEGTPHPDIHGVWQAFSEAEYNLEGQAAQPAAVVHPGVLNGNPVPHAPVLALGALGGIPPSQGVVVGGAIPYRRRTGRTVPAPVPA